MKIDELRNLTETLLQYNEEAKKNFILSRETGKQGDFFKEVKPFADKVKDCCEQWEPLAMEWVMSESPKNLHALQIRNTAENIQMVSVRAFFPDTSLNKFKSHIQSIDFILRRMLERLEVSS
ncbi:YppE family protein [Bacillus sp. FJAT-49732]|uniref:YppE family protein n=1 Tax=Lederbergia citrisecunda TaxID=2833583 RepID=A0A942YKB2_9BACI|nr:YppE family protein [Lederbergia citrisecunda]MBS4199472.1 YppE family protein [Lederbergia citrisecunda]